MMMDDDDDDILAQGCLSHASDNEGSALGRAVMASRGVASPAAAPGGQPLGRPPGRGGSLLCNQLAVLLPQLVAAQCALLQLLVWGAAAGGSAAGGAPVAISLFEALGWGAGGSAAGPAPAGAEICSRSRKAAMPPLPKRARKMHVSEFNSGSIKRSVSAPAVLPACVADPC